MKSAASNSGELTAEELHLLRALGHAVDGLLDESLRTRENLTQTFRRLFPQLLALTGARAAAIRTRDEELSEQLWTFGEWGDLVPDELFAKTSAGVERLPEDLWVAQSLAVMGVEVGTMGMLFESSPPRLPDSNRMVRMLHTISEELDTVLMTVQTAAEKHHLILQFNDLLANPVFEQGMDGVVQALAERVRVPGFVLVYRDAVTPSVVHYRTYHQGRLEHASGTRPSPALEGAVAAHGKKLVARGDQNLARTIGPHKAVEAVLISSTSSAEPMGKILLWSPGDGFSAFTLDLIRVLASTLSQRLTDYNRERIHLSQFFPSAVIDELLKDPRYAVNCLTARDEEVGILFVDINGFSRLCEQVLESPARIGRFVDEWSERAVQSVWRHGGVFDKMVGDCVIGLFGPPFFRSSSLTRVEGALRAALEIQAFTAAMSESLDMSRMEDALGVSGLGVAAGIHLAPTFCGLFGPNHQYTGFSTGMNETARLQALAGFRETLVMAPARLLLEDTADPVLSGLSYGPATETAVKNVGQPLRYYRLNPPAR